MKLYRPGPDGMEPNPVEPRNWRGRLRSRRWGAPPLENPEIEPTSPRMGAAFFVGLAVLTFVLLVLGYGTGFWGA